MPSATLFLPLVLVSLILSGSASSETKPHPQESAAVRSARPTLHRSFVVVIDAGHGGKDGGALGQNGTLEKDVVLSIAKKLGAFIQGEPGMRSIMVRSDDRFLDLHKRAEVAHKAGADLFISLHADAYEDNLTQGSSVFTLSETGATSEAARYLADREGATLVSGLDLRDQDMTLATILVDMSKNATMEASDKAAASLITALEKEFRIHNHAIQKANFAVLRSLDVPSVLIETGFISNPEEEERLLDPGHQKRLAKALFEGIRSYARTSARTSGPG